jgi:hypothetical protein
MKVTIRNVSNVPQWAIVKGSRVEIAPLAQKTVEDYVAEALIRDAAPLAIQVVSANQYEEAVQNYETESYVWLANATGNPSEPATVRVQHTNRETGRTELREMDNPIKDPRMVILTRPAYEEEYTTASGNVRSRMIAQSPVTLPPYGILKIKAVEADLLLSELTNEFGKSLIKRARAIPEYVPQMDADYSAMRCFAELLLGNDHPIVQKAPKEGKLRTGRGAEKAKDQKVFEAKQELFESLWFFLVDPTVRLPTAAEFYSYYNGPDVDEDVSDDVIAAAIEQADKDLELEA